MNTDLSATSVLGGLEDDDLCMIRDALRAHVWTVQRYGTKSEQLDRVQRLLTMTVQVLGERNL